MHITENYRNLNEAQLTEIVEQHPYYHLGQFRLLAHLFANNNNNELQKQNNNELLKQTSKTALFFCNHKWLNYQLHIENKSKAFNSLEINDPSIAEPLINLRLESHYKQETKKETAIPFEPLYTVDYFASQGIKITEEPISNDKLASQLKSFTEWLKSMKKIHPQNLSQADESIDKKIHKIAETSNASTEVITESMAEVLIKQDKIEKAIDMYRKLSLNNPSKSAYFAAKIQSLKPQ